MKRLQRDIMKKFGFAGLFVALAMTVAAEDARPLYENNFERAEVGKVPTNMLVLDGDFAVKADATNKFLELPGEPLDTYGVLFGPAEKSDVAVGARFNGTAHGRRGPVFGVGLNGQSGYKLEYSGGKKALEIHKGDAIVATVPFEWKPGEWTMMRLQIRKAGDVWKLEGKAWQGGIEPAATMISYDETTEPTPGRASIWGMPYSGTPIQFDDLLLKQLEPAK
jgi:hypothetical protein